MGSGHVPGALGRVSASLIQPCRRSEMGFVTEAQAGSCVVALAAPQGASQGLAGPLKAIGQTVPSSTDVIQGSGTCGSSGREPGGVGAQRLAATFAELLLPPRFPEKGIAHS